MKKTLLPALLLGIFSATALMADRVPGDEVRPTSGRPDPNIHSSYRRTESGPRPQWQGYSPGAGNPGVQPPTGTPPSNGRGFRWPDLDDFFDGPTTHSGSSFKMNTPNSHPSHAMPEPTGLVELGVCAMGLGLFAWRRRKAPAAI
jgi:hypothetical protein